MRRIIAIIICIALLSVCGYRIYRDQQRADQLAELVIQLSETITQLRSELAQAQSDIQAKQDELTASNDTLVETKETYRKLFSENYDLQQEYEEAKLIFDYCQKNLVFVIRHEKEYHRPGCPFIHMATAPFQHYTISNAEAAGYERCILCVH